MTYMPSRHRRWVSRLALSQADDDRRRFQRVEGTGLMAEIEKRLVDVDDISVAGLRVGGIELPYGHSVRFKLYPRQGTRLALNEAVPAVAQVIGVEDGGCRLRFTSFSFSLAKLIVRHIAERTGARPFIIR